MEIIQESTLQQSRNVTNTSFLFQELLTWVILHGKALHGKLQY